MRISQAFHVAIAQAAFALALLGVSPTLPALPLWEIQGASNRVFLLGSIHFLRQGSDVLPPEISAAYNEAEILVMELDLDDLDPAASQAAVRRLGIDPAGRDLAQLLGPKDFAEVRNRLADLGIGIAVLQPLEPWLAAITLTQLELQRLGFSADAGIEQQLLRRAQQDGKDVRGLETLDQQLGALDGLSAAAQREFLFGTLDEISGMEARIDDIVAAWRSGDLAAMERELLDSLAGQPELYRRIVVERNRSWARQIEGLRRERGDILLVVGALHLVGPDSVITLLPEAKRR